MAQSVSLVLRLVDDEARQDGKVAVVSVAAVIDVTTLLEEEAQEVVGMRAATLMEGVYKGLEALKGVEGGGASGTPEGGEGEDTPEDDGGDGTELQA